MTITILLIIFILYLNIVSIYFTTKKRFNVDAVEFLPIIFTSAIAILFILWTYNMKNTISYLESNCYKYEEYIHKQ